MSKYITIKPCDIANGLGCRVVIFLSGCIHHCKNCHNPQTWDKNNGIEFTDSTMNKIRKYLDKPFIDGITLSGGDPLYEYNQETTLKIIDMAHNEFPNKNIWLYTGYTFERIIQDKSMFNIIKNINILVDGPFIEDLKDITYRYAGSRNQRVIDVQASLRLIEFNPDDKNIPVIFDYNKFNKY